MHGTIQVISTENSCTMNLNLGKYDMMMMLQYEGQRSLACIIHIVSGGYFDDEMGFYGWFLEMDEKKCVKWCQYMKGQISKSMFVHYGGV